MSLVFNAASTDKKGIIQFYEDEIGANPGEISGNSTKLVKTTASINLAFDDFWSIAIPASGKWQLDDSNYDDYPFIYCDIVSGRRDYAFTTDEAGNLILDIYKVFIKTSATATTYTEVFPIDAQSENESLEMNSETTTGGIPVSYDKTGNGLLFSPTFNYSAPSGIKLAINREASYFTSADTTKKPGVAGIFHRYFVIRPALDYVRINRPDLYPRLKNEVMEMEQNIKMYYAGRDRGTRRFMTPNVENNK